MSENPRGYRCGNCRLGVLRSLLPVLFGWSSGWRSLRRQSTEGKRAATQQQFTQLIADGSESLRKGDNIAAEKAFRHALVLDPESVPVLNNLAIALARQRREA